MKTLFKLAVVAAILVLAVPVVMYRTASPCGMLKKELVSQTKDRIAEMGQAGREQARDLGGAEAERIAEGIGTVVGSTMEGLAEGVAQARVDNMSLRECASELWRIKTGR